MSIGVQDTVAQLIGKIQTELNAGYRRIKIKIKPGWDVDVVKEVRREFPEILLMADANSAYTLADTDRLKQLDAFNLMMIEQPLSHDDIIDHAQLQPKLDTPICLDECIRTAHHAEQALRLGAGRIVNIVSSAGLYGNLGQAAYASAKAGLFGLTRVTAMDLARAQITANAVAPFARTRVTDIIQPANDAQKTYKERALKIGAHHVANLVTALCSPAGKAITGQLLGVRGREVFLFGQPRPVGKIDSGQPDSIAQELTAGLGSKFTDLTTDLEAFNTEPLV